VIPWIGGALMWLGEVCVAILLLGVLTWLFHRGRDWEIRNAHKRDYE
jgi:hypothetical protein